MKYVVSLSVAVITEAESREQAQREAERSLWSIPGVDYTSVVYVHPLSPDREEWAECAECKGECGECQ